MVSRTQGIGLAIGDDFAVAVGFGGEEGWEVAEPAVVCPPSPGSPVELLLAGREAQAAGQAPLLQSPRRWGYIPGEPAVAKELLTALLMTLHQQILPDLLAQPAFPVVIALSHTLPATVASVMAEAAKAAGWGEVRIVSELAAMAGLHFTPGEPGMVQVDVADRRWRHEGSFQVMLDAGTHRLILESLRSERSQETEPPPSAHHLARGAARLSALGPALRLERGQSLPLVLGIALPSGEVLSVGEAAGGEKLVRALTLPDPEGALLRLAVGCQPEAGACQIAGEVIMEPDPTDADGPWLLTAQLGAAGLGQAELHRPDGTSVWRQPIEVRLP
ncbi:MAG: hypothetical protein K0R39_4691 [Symbiobacteriaceae bacterium]|jgi:hypothetical protein|nr:hypothetical protein [Symbiobacteriaceae bacterium]